MANMVYGIIGTGAIGGYYGGRLCESGQEVHFLFRSDYDYVCEHGLQVNSCRGDFHLDNINAYDQTSKMPKCDVVLVCLKTTTNKHLKDLLPPLLKPETLVVMIQNGIGVEADVQSMFPGVSLAAGLAFICSAKTEHGIVNHQDYGQINIGNFSCPDNSIIGKVIDDFNAAGIKAAEVEYNEARWKKEVWNMPFNGMTVALNTSTDLLLKNPSTRQLISDLMAEVVHGAQACGVENISEDFIDKMLTMTDSMTPYSPSMKLDFDYHRPMEIDNIYTHAIEEAERHGFKMPKLRMLEQQLRFIQEQYLKD